jgi:hypothetical protein
MFFLRKAVYHQAHSKEPTELAGGATFTLHPLMQNTLWRDDHMGGARALMPSQH